MYLQYGDYQHAQNECEVTINRQSLFSDLGELYGYKEVWNIRGMLLRSTSAALTTAMSAMKAAYTIQGKNLRLYFDDGTLSNHYIVAADCKGGPRVIEGPSFPEGNGAEYSTYRSFSITVEAEVLDPKTQTLAFTETLTFSGGGPMTVHLQTQVGEPQKQQVAEATVYKATQTGQAVGQFSYPATPAPLWPEALMHPLTQTTRGSPKRAGPLGRPYYTEFPISWSYQFESSRPLKGNPNVKR